MKVTRSILLLCLMASPIASAGVAFLTLSSLTMPLRVLAQPQFQNPLSIPIPVPLPNNPTVPISIAPSSNRVNTQQIPVSSPVPYNPTASAPGTYSIYSPQIRAFLDVISWAETGKIDASSYSTLVFKGFFNDFSTHPKKKQCGNIGGRRVCSTAAGRYQIMDFNWNRLAPRLKLKDFSPESQDRMALQFIQEKGALEDVLAGRFEDAACKVGGVWASFPCNRYGQHPKSMNVLRQFYDQQLQLWIDYTSQQNLSRAR